METIKFASERLFWGPPWFRGVATIELGKPNAWTFEIPIQIGCPTQWGEFHFFGGV